MQAKLAIAFGVILALGIGFMTYRHFQKGADTQAYKESTYSRMTEAAQQTPEAGLAYMGMAIKNYHREENKYPAELTDLWPDYIQDKGFIENVDWEYTPAEKNFRLSKTVDFKTAYIDNNLSPRSEEKSVRVASRESAPSTTASRARSASRKAAPSGQKAIDGTRYARLEPSKEREYSQDDLKKMREKLIKELLAGNLSHTDYQMETLEKPEITGPVYTIEGTAGDIALNDNKKYLAWKNADGSLGFGNIMYPDLERHLAYQNGQWLRAKYPDAPLSKEGINDGKPLKEQSLSQKYGNTYLAWKNANGALGFGNVMYPKNRHQLIYQDGRWTNTQRNDRDEGVSVVPAAHILDTTPEALARKHGDEYLTWKRTDGAIGFGNVMYPEASEYNVYTNGQWLDAAQNPGQEATAPPATTSGNAQTENTNHADLVEKYSNNLYLWENPSGALGFSNVNYPDKNAVPVSPAATAPNTIGGGRYDTE